MVTLRQQVVQKNMILSDESLRMSYTSSEMPAQRLCSHQQQYSHSKPLSLMDLLQEIHNEGIESFAAESPFFVF